MKNKKVLFKFLAIMVASSSGFIISGLINKNLRSFAVTKAQIHNNVSMPEINIKNSRGASKLYTDKMTPNSSSDVTKVKNKQNNSVNKKGKKKSKLSKNRIYIPLIITKKTLTYSSPATFDDIYNWFLGNEQSSAAVRCARDVLNTWNNENNTVTITEGNELLYILTLNLSILNEVLNNKHKNGSFNVDEYNQICENINICTNIIQNLNYNELKETTYASCTLADIYDTFSICKSAIESINKESIFKNSANDELNYARSNLLDVKEKMSIIDKSISYYEKFGNFVYNMNSLREILESLGTFVNWQIDDFQSQSSMVNPILLDVFKSTDYVNCSNNIASLSSLRSSLEKLIKKMGECLEKGVDTVKNNKLGLFNIDHILKNRNFEQFSDGFYEDDLNKTMVSVDDSFDMDDEQIDDNDGMLLFGLDDSIDNGKSADDNGKSADVTPVREDAALINSKSEKNNIHNDEDTKQALSEYRDKLIDNSKIYRELNLDDYSDLNVCKLFLDMFLTLDSVMIKFGDKFENQLNDGDISRAKLVAIALKKGLLDDSKIKGFCSNATYLDQLRVFSDNYDGEIDSLDVKATFDCVTEFSNKIENIFKYRLKPLLDFKNKSANKENKVNGFIQDVCGQFVKFYMKFIKLFVEKTKTFSLTEFRKSVLKLKKNPNDVNVRDKVEKQIKLMIEFFNDSMNKCFGEEDVVDVASIFGENDNKGEESEITKENANEDVKNKTIEEKRAAYYTNKNNVTENSDEEADKKAYIDEVIKLNKANRSKNRVKVSEATTDVKNTEEDEYDLNKITEKRAAYYEKLDNDVNKKNSESDKNLNSLNKNLSEYDIEGASRNITQNGLNQFTNNDWSNNLFNRALGVENNKKEIEENADFAETNSNDKIMEARLKWLFPNGEAENVVESNNDNKVYEETTAPIEVEDNEKEIEEITSPVTMNNDDKSDVDVVKLRGDYFKKLYGNSNNKTQNVVESNNDNKVYEETTAPIEVEDNEKEIEENADFTETNSNDKIMEARLKWLFPNSEAENVAKSNNDNKVYEETTVKNVNNDVNSVVYDWDDDWDDKVETNNYGNSNKYDFKSIDDGFEDDKDDDLNFNDKVNKKEPSHLSSQTAPVIKKTNNIKSMFTPELALDKISRDDSTVDYSRKFYLEKPNVEQKEEDDLEHYDDFEEEVIEEAEELDLDEFNKEQKEEEDDLEHYDDFEEEVIEEAEELDLDEFNKEQNEEEDNDEDNEENEDEIEEEIEIENDDEEEDNDEEDDNDEEEDEEEDNEKKFDYEEEVEKPDSDEFNKEENDETPEKTKANDDSKVNYARKLKISLDETSEETKANDENEKE